VFAFGIGSSVNRFLLDKIAEQGRGEVEYVGLNDDGSAAARRFHERVRNPLLTDISIDWGGLPATDIYPKRIPDLFGAKPLILTGRFTSPGRGVVRLKGKMAGREFSREIPVEFPESESGHDVLASLWARTRIEDLMGQDYAGAQQGTMKKDLRETVTQLGLECRLMTQFTSFVAVEEMIVTDGGQPRRIDVPVEVPEGMNRAAVFGETSASRPTGLFTGVGFSKGRLARPLGVGAGVAAPAPTPARADADEISIQKEMRDKVATLHPTLRALVERLRKKDPKPAPEESQFVRDGKAELQIWLTDKSAANLARLKTLGFEIVLDPKNSSLVIGRIAVERVDALTKLTFIRYIAPQLSSK
jgi:Ca-activated chloride channel family protein